MPSSTALDLSILLVQVIASAAIASVSMVGYRKFGSRTFLHLSMSFYLVGLGILGEAISTLSTGTTSDALLLAGLSTEAVGYFVLAISHVYTVRSEIASSVPSLLPVLFASSLGGTIDIADGIARSASFFLLLYILGESIIFFYKNRNREALLPIVGFTLLTVSLFARMFLLLITSETLAVDSLKLLGFIVLAGPVVVLVARLRGGGP